MTDPVTITFVPEQIVTWLIIGLIAGFAASVLVRGYAISATASIIVGLIGALVGGLLFSLLGIQVSATLTQGITLRYIDIIVSFIGALIVLILFGATLRRRL